MAWFIDDLDQKTIRITDGAALLYDVPKFRIFMTVTEPELFLYYNDRERGDGGDERLITMNYLDVVDNYSGYIDNPSSATDLMNQIEAMIISGWTSIAGGDLLTAKADLLSHDGVSDTILPGGTNEYILSRNNATSTGLEWIAKSSIINGGLSVADTDTVDLTLTGASLEADVITQMSITSDASGVKLSGDEASPGSLEYYGTNNAGTKGYYPINSYVLASTGTVTSTNTTSEEALWNVEIPAGAVTTNDWVEIRLMNRKTSGTGTNTFRVRINTATGVGGSIISNYAGTSTQTSVQGPMVAITGASAQISTPAFNGTTYAVAAVDTVATAFSVASSIWLNFTNQKVTGTDGFELRTATVIIHKYRA